MYKTTQKLVDAILEDRAWIISDTHFFHKNIGKYCNRPESWQELIITNWNTRIQKDDIVFHLGDFAFCGKNKLKELLSGLNGEIHLLKGNHDNFSNDFYSECGIYPRTELWMNGTDKKWVFSHRPIDVLHGYYNFHGHIHNLESQSPYHINVSIEMMDYRPYKMSEILEKFALS